MRSVVWTLALITLMTLLQAPGPLRGQPLASCPSPSAEAPQTPKVTIGHFAESEGESGEFCRYLTRNRMRPTFQNLGSLRDDKTVRRVQAALEGGTIDVLWLSSFAMGMLGSASTLVMKVLAVTDFPIVHVVSHDVNARLVTDTAFAPAGVMVAHGYAEAYADILFKAIGVAVPRCLEAPVNCDIHPNDATLVGGLIAYLMNQPSHVVVYVSSTFSPKNPDPIVLSLVQTQFSLVGVPAQTVIKMDAVHGTFAAVSIPKGHYGVGRRPDVPSTDVPTAAAPLVLVSSTPPKVAERVRDLVIRINSALLDVEPRVSRDNLRKSLELARDLRGSLGGRVVLHEEYARQLERRGLSTILPSPGPTSPSPTVPPPSPQPPPPTGGAVEIRSFIARPSVVGPGQRTMLCWVVANARSARIDPDIGALGPSDLQNGCRTIQPRETTPYTLTATGSDGRSVSRNLTVVVRQPLPPPPPPPRQPAPPNG